MPRKSGQPAQERDVSLTQGLGFIPIFYGALLADVAQEPGCWRSPVRGVTLHHVEPPTALGLI